MKTPVTSMYHHHLFSEKNGRAPGTILGIFDAPSERCAPMMQGRALDRTLDVYWKVDCCKLIQWDYSKLTVRALITWRLGTSISGCLGAWKSFFATKTPSLKRYSKMATRFFLGINILNQKWYIFTHSYLNLCVSYDENIMIKS